MGSLTETFIVPSAETHPTSNGGRVNSIRVLRPWPHRVKTFDDYAPSEVLQLPMIGKIPFTAYSGDNRFSACLYIPQSYTTTGHLQLAVLVHSSDRDAAELRNAFIDFAEATRCAVLAPLFPQGLIDPNETDNYKKLEYKSIRFDLILLGMMDEVRERWPKIDTSRVLMQGFSGGAQFVHRFTYLHPERLRAVVIAAPGSITSLDTGADYPDGVRDIDTRFGIRLNAKALRDVRVLLLVGDLDDSIEHLLTRGLAPSECKNRVRIVAELQCSLDSFGLSTRMLLVPGSGHDAEKMYQSTSDFFTEIIAQI